MVCRAQITKDSIQEIMYQLSLKLGCTQGTAELARKNYNFFPTPTPASFSQTTSAPPTSLFISVTICSHTAPAPKELKPPREGSSGDLLSVSGVCTGVCPSPPHQAPNPWELSHVGALGKGRASTAGLQQPQGFSATTESQNPSGWKSPPSPAFTQIPPAH